MKAVLIIAILFLAFFSLINATNNDNNTFILPAVERTNATQRTTG